MHWAHKSAVGTEVFQAGFGFKDAWQAANECRTLP